MLKEKLQAPENPDPPAQNETPRLAGSGREKAAFFGRDLRVG